jgi:hypothetical protein
MTFIITTRNPKSKKLLIITNEDDDYAAEFETEPEAMEAAHETTLCKAWGCEVVEVA